MIFDSTVEVARKAAFDPAPRRLSRVRTFAYLAGRSCTPFSQVEEALDGDDGWWPRARPGCIRAATKAEEVCNTAYRRGQVDRARAAVEERAADGNAPPLVEFSRDMLFDMMAEATHALDGPHSTLIEPCDLVAIAADFIPIGDHAERHAELTLRERHCQAIISEVEAETRERTEDIAASEWPRAHNLSELAEALREAEPAVEPIAAHEIASRTVASAAKRGIGSAVALQEEECARVDFEYLGMIVRIAERGKQPTVDMLNWAKGSAQRDYRRDPISGIVAQHVELLGPLIGVTAARIAPAPDNLKAEAEALERRAREAGRKDIAEPLARARLGMNQQEVAPLAPKPFTWIDPTAIPRRDWLYGNHLIRGEISLTLAPGGVGKTSLMVAEALAMVSGRKLLHDQPPRPLRVWLWNGEEPEDELRRRITAAAVHFGLGRDILEDRLFVDSGNDLQLVLAEQSRDGTVVHKPIIDQLVAALAQRQIDVMIVDPFISTHHVGENDSTGMQQAASAWKEVAYRAGLAIDLAHHTRKIGDYEASVDDGRGSSALKDKARHARALSPMTTSDAGKFGMRASERFQYFASGAGDKSNMAARASHKAWYRLQPIGLDNGTLNAPQDIVAVVVPWAPPEELKSLDQAAIARLADIMGDTKWRENSQASNRPDWIGVAVAEAFEVPMEGDWAKDVKPIIKELAERTIIIKSHTIGERRKSVPVYTMGARGSAKI